MEILGSGLITLFNGAYNAVGALTNPIAIAVVIVAAGLATLAYSEVEEMNRQGTKPVIGRH